MVGCEAAYVEGSAEFDAVGPSGSCGAAGRKALCAEFEDDGLAQGFIAFRMWFSAREFIRFGYLPLRCVASFLR